MVATKVLIIEDDPNIVDLIRSNLVVRGFDTVVSAGTKVIDLLDLEQPDMVLLDLMLPEADGFELCRELRERSPVGIIVVSARGGEQDKVTALNMGADDYMTKPFGIEELLARDPRHACAGPGPSPRPRPKPAPARIAIGGLSINLTSKQVTARRRRGAPHSDRVRAAARTRRQPGETAVPCAPAYARSGATGTRAETEYIRVYISRLRAQAGAAWQPAR